MCQGLPSRPWEKEKNMNQTKLFLLIITIILLSSCAVKMVAEYDQNTAYKIVEVSKMVNMFYIKLADHNSQERQYIKFMVDYRQIEVELEALVLLNKMRPLNEESTQICEHILQNWLEFKAAHKQNDSYKDVMIELNWNTIREQFYALAVAEAAKK
jgi:Rps23 Pro-64 3,4-dihydroxylase Tpa1-like proline 4-hydroxylase